MKAGGVIFRCRKRKGLSQTELEALTGITKTSISNWESGRFEPSVGKFEILLNAMGYELKVVEKKK